MSFPFAILKYKQKNLTEGDVMDYVKELDENYVTGGGHSARYGGIVVCGNDRLGEI